jgi:hypothetical protein
MKDPIFVTLQLLFDGSIFASYKNWKRKQNNPIIKTNTSVQFDK